MERWIAYTGGCVHVLHNLGAVCENTTHQQATRRRRWVVMWRHPVQQHLHHYNAHCKNVSLGIHLSSFPSLWSNVAQGAADCGLIVCRRPHKTEINDDNMWLLEVTCLEHEIGLFDIAMYQTIGMHMCKAHEALLEDTAPPILIHLHVSPGATMHQSCEVPAFVQLLNHVVGAVVLKDVERKRYIGVPVQTAQNDVLVVETINVCFVHVRFCIGLDTAHLTACTFAQVSMALIAMSKLLAYFITCHSRRAMWDNKFARVMVRLLAILKQVRVHAKPHLMPIQASISIKIKPQHLSFHIAKSNLWQTQHVHQHIPHFPNTTYVQHSSPSYSLIALLNLVPKVSSKRDMKATSICRRFNDLACRTAILAEGAVWVQSAATGTHSTGSNDRNQRRRRCARFFKFALATDR